jgi:hypothetical protein
MKKLVALVALAPLLISVPAPAQIYPIPDGLGLYFDTYAVEYCRDGVTGPTSLYLILTNCSQPSGISGWECHVTYNLPPEVFEVGWVLPAGATNESTAPDFMVGLSVPAPNAPCILLATYGLLVFSSEIIWFYVGPADTPSIPGFAAYAAGDNPGNLIPMYPVSGSPDQFVAAVNYDCMPDSAQDETFGHVKAMYR